MDRLRSSHSLWGDWRQVWRAFFGFLRRPRLPDRPLPFGRKAVTQVSALLVLDWAVLALCLVAALSLETAGAVLPRPVDPEWTTAELLVLAVLAAPLLEELFFRSWLSGTKRGFGMFLVPATLVAAAASAQFFSDQVAPLAIALALIFTLVASVLAFSQWRDYRVPAAYRTVFHMHIG